MPNINLKRVVQEHKLNVREIAPLLFPKNKYPVLAMRRIIGGKGNLNSAQVSQLAHYCHCKIDELYTNGYTSIASRDMLTLTTDNYIATVDKQSWRLNVFDRGDKFHDELIFDTNITMSELLEKLDSVIFEHRTLNSNQ